MHNRTFPRGFCFFALAVVCLLLAPHALSQTAPSGSPVPPVTTTNGGPERIAVVVNSNSWASLTVANEYVRLRNIPACNVIYINTKDWPSFETMDLESFKTRLLGPVLDEIQKRGLARQIDCIAYSSDFPYYVSISWEINGRPGKDGGSLTGLTYLHEMVLAPDAGAKNMYPAFMGNANWYFHSPLPGGAPKGVDAAPAGFSSQIAWDATGHPAADGRRYLLSTMLAYTSGRGDSVSEAITCLRRAAAADGTRPAGTIMYGNNDGIRADVRRWGFDGAIARLKELGIDADKTGNNKDVNHNPDLPKAGVTLAGLMLGRANIKCRECKNAIVPGAIIDNMTSFGGGMGWNAEFQTSIGDFLRLGAAGTAGTVDEPMATQNKFPTAYMHVHYAAGCTLAESFYQSIYMPYQLLIIGDPLCAPWAKIPQVSIKDAAGGEIKINGKYSLIAQAATASPQWSQAELFIDGKFLDKVEKDKPHELDGAKLGDGWHEIRVTAMAGGPLQTRGGCVAWAQVGEDGKQLTCTANESKVPWGDKVKLTFHNPRGFCVNFLCNSRQVGLGEGESGEVAIPASQLGMGISRIYPVTAVGAGHEGLRGKPIEIEVLPPALLKPATDVPPEDKLSPGLLVTAKGKAPYVVTDMRKIPTLETAKIDKDEPFEMDGFLEAPTDDVYQFQFMFTGKLDVKIDGQDFPLPPAGKYWRLVPISLAKGAHHFHAAGVATDSRNLEFRFGAAGVRCPYVLGPKSDNASNWPVSNFRHVTAQEKVDSGQ
jgi:hypothetical protein